MTHLPMKLATAGAIACAAIAAPATATLAADEKPKALSPAAQFSDRQLTSFAAAAKQVSAIRRKYVPQFEAATDEAKKKEIVQTAQSEMRQAIQGNGLTLEQYNNVLVAAKDDKALAEKLGKIMDDTPAPKG